MTTALKSSRAKGNKPYFPELGTSWTMNDQDRACREGWAIFEATREGITVFEIERCDMNDPPYEDAHQFENDDEALAQVRKRAKNGSSLHRRALAIHRRWQREWRVLASEEDDGGDFSPEGHSWAAPNNSWIGPVLVLLAQKECDPLLRWRCVKGLKTVLGVARLLAKTDKDRKACEGLEDYVVYELSDD